MDVCNNGLGYAITDSDLVEIDFRTNSFKVLNNLIDKWKQTGIFVKSQITNIKVLKDNELLCFEPNNIFIIKDENILDSI